MADSGSAASAPPQKSKAQLKRERRELQEKQRAAKAASQQQKEAAQGGEGAQGVGKKQQQKQQKQNQQQSQQPQKQQNQQQQQKTQQQQQQKPQQQQQQQKQQQKNVPDGKKLAKQQQKVPAKSPTELTPSKEVSLDTVRKQRSREVSESGSLRVPADVRQDDPKTRKKESKKLERHNIPERAAYNKEEMSAFFRHLNQFKLDGSLTEGLRFSDAKVHPAFVKLGLQMMHGQIVGANSRCVAFVCALLQLVEDYECPASKVWSRDFEATTLSPNLQFLAQCRPHAVTVRNAVKYFKHLLNVSREPEPSSLEMKQLLRESMENYVHERVQLADKAIAGFALQKIRDGDVILVYGNSSVVGHVLITAHQERTFRVIVADSRPRFEGRQMLFRLRQEGLTCDYVALSCVAQVMPAVTRCMVGAHAITANGFVLSRVGTGQLACVAAAFNRPLLVCCETYKFWDRVQTDSLVFNELSDPRRLISHKMEDQENVTCLDLEYDVTPPDLVSAVITELAILPCTSVPVVLRVKQMELGS